jgi:murein DD-endopeptidase MepM/ murein hydrolase activator NlpD
MFKNIGIIFCIFFIVACGTGVNDLTFTGICDGYSDSSSAPYVVPWEVGTTQIISQGNCGSVTHNGKAKYAYDVGMEIGTAIVASRAGVVYEVVKDKSDGNGCADGENHIYIEHADGSVAKYLHLTKNGSTVSVGDVVTRGQKIGTSGNTGCSGGPHLHFEVNTDRDSGMSIPVTFKNVGDNGRGLQAGQSYIAK